MATLKSEKPLHSLTNAEHRARWERIAAEAGGAGITLAELDRRADLSWESAVRNGGPKIYEVAPEDARDDFRNWCAEEKARKDKSA